MVLGDDTTRIAPAHHILRSQQGTGWIQNETGTFDKVCADYWPDKTIREVARRVRCLHQGPDDPHGPLLIYQHATEDRDRAIADTLDRMIQDGSAK